MAGARKVLAPDGRQWKVGREWRPRRVRLTRRRPSIDSLGDVPFVDDLGAVGVLIAIIVLVVVLVTVVWPLLALALEIVLLVLLFFVGLAARVATIQPWTVIARSEDRYAERHAWRVKGWRASRETIAEVATALESGREPRPTGSGVLTGAD